MMASLISGAHKIGAEAVLPIANLSHQSASNDPNKFTRPRRFDTHQLFGRWSMAWKIRW